jgi:hypothetical protein
LLSALTVAALAVLAALAALIAGAAMPVQARAFQVLVLAAMIAALAGTGRRAALWLMPDVHPLSRAVAAFTVAITVVSVPATWLGHFGLLYPGPFLLCVAAAFLLSRLLPLKPPLPEEADTPAAPDGLVARIERILLFAAAAALVLVAIRETGRIAFWPPGLGADDLNYHLSAVAVWRRYGDLRMIKFSMGDWSTAFYPVLPEISAWALLAPFADSDVAARWSQLPYFLASLVALAAVARRLGVSPRGAALAVILYASIERLLGMAFTAGNDHVTAFFTLAALDGGLATGRRPRPGRAVAAGLALGLLAASKYIGLFCAVTVLAVLGAALMVHRARLQDVQGIQDVPGSTLSLPSLCAVLGACMLFAGGYTYLRNAWTVGNPVYPAPIALFGREILPGEEETSLAVRMRDPEAEIDVPRFLTRRSDLFGPLFPYLLLPAAVLAPLWAFARRRPLTGLVLALPTILFLQFLYWMYDHRDMRYFAAGVGLAAVGFAWLVDRPATWAAVFRSLVLLLVILHLGQRFDASARMTVAAFAVVAGLSVFLAQNRERLAGRLAAWRRAALGWPGWIATAAVAVFGILALGDGVEAYQAIKLQNHPGPEALESIAGPAGTRVAYTGFNQPYLWFGSRLQNDVRIVPRTASLDAEHYRWNGSAALPYTPGPYWRWKRNLVRLGVDLVVIQRSAAEEDPERRWIVAHPGDFRRLYEDSQTEIWKFLSGRRDR